MIYGCYGRDPWLLSGRVPVVAKTERRLADGVTHEMHSVRASKESPESRVKIKSDFPEAGPFNEMGVMGVLAIRLQGLNKELGWNKAGILCYQGTVIFKQNDANVVEFHLWTDAWVTMVANSKFKDWPRFVEPAREGHIGLQDHGNDVWFRNFKTKEL